MRDLGLDLVLLHTRFHEAAHPLEGLAGDGDRALDLFHLLLRLAAADAVHDRRAALHAVQRVLCTQFGVLAVLAGLHLVMLAQVLVAVQVQVFALRHQALDGGLKTACPEHRANAAQIARFLLAELGALPDRDQLAGLAHKEDLAVLRVHRIREEQQDRLLLVDAREVEDIAGLLEGHRTIGTGGHDVVAVEDGQTAFLQMLTETGAVLAVGGGGEGLVAHEFDVKCEGRMGAKVQDTRHKAQASRCVGLETCVFDLVS